MSKQAFSRAHGLVSYEFIEDGKPVRVEMPVHAFGARPDPGEVANECPPEVELCELETLDRINLRGKVVAELLSGDLRHVRCLESFGGNRTVREAIIQAVRDTADLSLIELAARLQVYEILPNILSELTPLLSAHLAPDDARIWRLACALLRLSPGNEIAISAILKLLNEPGRRDRRGILYALRSALDRGASGVLLEQEAADSIVDSVSGIEVLILGMLATANALRGVAKTELTSARVSDRRHCASLMASEMRAGRQWSLDMLRRWFNGEPDLPSMMSVAPGCVAILGDDFGELLALRGTMHYNPIVRWNACRMISVCPADRGARVADIAARDEPDSLIRGWLERFVQEVR